MPRAEDAPTDTFHIPAGAKNKEDAKKFLAYLETERRASPHTRKAYRVDLEQYAAHLAGAGEPIWTDATVNAAPSKDRPPLPGRRAADERPTSRRARTRLRRRRRSQRPRPSIRNGRKCRRARYHRRPSIRRPSRL